MKQKVSLAPLGREEQNVSTNQYLFGSNIVQGLPATSQINQPKQNDQVPRTITLEQPQRTQSTSATRLSIIIPTNRDNGQYYMKFSCKYFGYSFLHFFVFGAEGFIQQFMYGYQLTYSSLYGSYIMLLFALVFVYRGSRRRATGLLYISQFFLVFFILSQIFGFIYAVIYPIRYSFDNQAANDAMSDYNYYYGAQQNQNQNYDNGYRILSDPAYSMKEICQILSQAFVNFSEKSYYQYCLDVLNGKSDGSRASKYSPLLIGLLIYYIAGVLAALYLGYVLCRMTINYCQFITDTIRCYPLSPSIDGDEGSESIFATKKTAPPQKKKSKKLASYKK